MTHTTISCPKCGYIFRKELGSDWTLLCSPISKCPNCGGICWDEHRKEWLCMNDDERARVLGNGKADSGISVMFASGFIFIAFFIMSIMEFTDDNVGLGAVMLLISLVFLYPIIKMIIITNKGKQELNNIIEKKDVIESLKRTNNKEYLDLLLSHNCKIYPVDLKKYYDNESNMT